LLKNVIENRHQGFQKKPGGLNPELIFTIEILEPEGHALKREKQYPIAVF